MDLSQSIHGLTPLKRLLILTLLAMVDGKLSFKQVNIYIIYQYIGVTYVCDSKDISVLITLELN